MNDWSESEFSEELVPARLDGEQLLQHLLIHSMQHRSEAAVMLTQYGRSPGNLDFIFFV